MEAGAYGAKINGSGEGGCMFAICDAEDIDSVTKAIEKANGTSFIVNIDEGVRLEKLDN